MPGLFMLFTFAAVTAVGGMIFVPSLVALAAVAVTPDSPERKAENVRRLFVLLSFAAVLLTPLLIIGMLAAACNTD